MGSGRAPECMGKAHDSPTLFGSRVLHSQSEATVAACDRATWRRRVSAPRH